MKEFSFLCSVALVCFAPAALAQQCDGPHCGPYSDGNGNPSKCSDYSYGCDMWGQCLLV